MLDLVTPQILPRGPHLCMHTIRKYSSSTGPQDILLDLDLVMPQTLPRGPQSVYAY